jgi:hypothetical protein
MTEQEAHRILLHSTAEAFRIYHLIEDQRLADRQYQLALQLENLLNESRYPFKEDEACS